MCNNPPHGKYFGPSHARNFNNEGQYERKTGSDRVTPDIPERIGSKLGNGKGEMDPDTLTGKDVANDVYEDEDYIENTTKVERPESDVGPETKGDAVAIITQPAKIKICNVPDIKSGSELDPASVFSMEIDTDKENDRVRAEEKSKSTDKKR